MDISKIKIFNAMQTNMKYLSARQEVIAENIANANTPGYGVKDLAPLNFDKILSGATSSALNATNVLHFTGVGSNSSAVASEIDAAFSEITPTGNKVVLEDESRKLSKTSSDYNMTTGVYRKMMEFIRKALGDRS